MTARPFTPLFPLALAGLLGSSHLLAAEVSSAREMLSGIDAKLNLRYRFEYVDQDGIANTAKASTLRSRVTLVTPSYKGFSVLGEVDNVSYLGDDKFNSTANGRTDYPVVADPDGTDFNQFYLKYQASQVDATGIAGRQQINHGNQRFVGGVAWRQNEQTYDGLRGMYKQGGLTLDYSYVAQVNRIFGPEDGAQPATWDGDLHFLRGDYAVNESHTLAAFGYELQIDEDARYPGNGSVNNSTTTVGVEYIGKIGALGLQATLAAQTDSGDSTLDYDATYYFAEASYDFGPVKALAAYEVLGSDNNVGFKTPLATLHKFQGFADKFLATPADGIEDFKLGLMGNAGPVKLAAFYHDFSAEDGGEDFGTEVDLVASWPITKEWLLEAKYASFSSDNTARFTDTDKAWMTVMFKL